MATELCVGDRVRWKDSHTNEECIVVEVHGHHVRVNTVPLKWNNAGEFEKIDQTSSEPTADTKTETWRDREPLL